MHRRLNLRELQEIAEDVGIENIEMRVVSDPEKDWEAHLLKLPEVMQWLLLRDKRWARFLKEEFFFKFFRPVFWIRIKGEEMEKEELEAWENLPLYRKEKEHEVEV